MTNFVLMLEKLCEKLSLQLNIKKYDVFGIAKEDNSASAKDKKPFALFASNKSSVTLRVWNDNAQVGIASTSNLSEEGLKIAFEMALNAAKFFDTNVQYDFSPLGTNKIENNLTNDVTFATTLELSKAAVVCEEKILKSHESMKSVPYNKVGQSFYERFYFNSVNACQYQKVSSTYCYFYPLAQEANKIPRQLGHVAVAKNFHDLNYLECANIAIEKTLSHLDYKKINSGKYTVVFAPEAFLDLISSFANFFNAQNVLDNKSLSTKETLNSQLSISSLNMVDAPLHPENIGKPLFDEEGTPTSELTIIENGILKNFIHTSYTAKIFNTQPTGHTSTGAKLTAHSHFLRIFSSDKQAIPESNTEYVYIEYVKALHAGINALQGSFSLPFDGFIVRNGKRDSIEFATVAGDFLTLLKNIVYVSPEEKVTHSGICPEIWVKDLSITGN